MSYIIFYLFLSIYVDLTRSDTWRRFQLCAYLICQPILGNVHCAVSQVEHLKIKYKQIRSMYLLRADTKVPSPYKYKGYLLKS